MPLVVYPYIGFTVVELYVSNANALRVHKPHAYIIHTYNALCVQN